MDRWDMIFCHCGCPFWCWWCPCCCPGWYRCFSGWWGFWWMSWFWRFQVPTIIDSWDMILWSCWCPCGSWWCPCWYPWRCWCCPCCCSLWWLWWMSLSWKFHAPSMIDSWDMLLSVGGRGCWCPCGCKWCPCWEPERCPYCLSWCSSSWLWWMSWSWKFQAPSSVDNWDMII